MPPVNPISPQERIEVIDVLRGFAVFGILLVNMAVFNSPWLYVECCDIEFWPALVDQAAKMLIRFVAEGKFYSLFSFLFGLGLTIQMDRLEAKGVHFVPLYLRRVGILLAIGIVHAYLFWMGDILRIYAVLGFFLLLFRKRSPTTLLIWAFLFVALLQMLIAALTGLMLIAQLFPQAATEIEKGLTLELVRNQVLTYQSLSVYAEGDFFEIMGQRALDVERTHIYAIFYWPSIFAMFLLGVYAGRRRIFQNLSEHLPFVGKVMWWGLAIGVIGNLGYVLGYHYVSRTPTSWLAIPVSIGIGFGAPAMCFFYASGIILLMQRDSWKQRLAPLSAVGRMALSNYLLQTLICTTLFYSYGLGLYGKVGSALGMLLTIIIYALQIPLSMWWLRRFRFGPMEWLWRSATYRSFQPMRKQR